MHKQTGHGNNEQRETETGQSGWKLHKEGGEENKTQDTELQLAK